MQSLVNKLAWWLSGLIAGLGGLAPLGAVPFQAEPPAVQAESPSVQTGDRTGLPQLPPNKHPAFVRKPETNPSWEYQPYEILVWIVHDDSELFRRASHAACRRVERDAELEEFSGWHVQCQPADSVWNARLNASWDTGLAVWTKSLADYVERLNQHKLILVRLLKSTEGYSVHGLELDLATRQWGVPTRLTAGEVDRIPGQVSIAMLRSFMPLGRIERVANDMAYVRTRGTALSRRLEIDVNGTPRETVNDRSPLWIRDTDILLPVIRRDARDNRPVSAEPIPWTFLTIQERSSSTLRCLTHTAQYAPLAGRSGAHVQKLALVVRPTPAPTVLFVTAEGSKTAAPLTGLEVYHCRYEEVAGKNYHLLGKTDWKGAISVPPESDGAVRYLIVRNGSIAIKRPVLPGLYPTLSAAVPTDRARVFAEGVATGLRGYVVDVLIQRMTLKHRIEILLEKKQFEKAAELLNKQYLTLPSAREVSIRLSQTEERLLNRKDADVGQRERIKKMFDELEQAVAELISDTKQAEELTSRVLNKDAAPPPKTKEDLLDEMLDQNLDEPADTPPAKVEDFD